MASLDSAAPDAWFRLEGGRLELGGAWTIGASARLDRELRGLKADGNVAIDASKLEKLDSSGAWLLVRTRRALEAGGAKVTGPTCPTITAPCWKAWRRPSPPAPSLPVAARPSCGACTASARPPCMSWPRVIPCWAIWAG